MPYLTYEEAVKLLADTHSDKIFKNKGVESAEIVLTELLNHAKDEVLIFSGNFKGDVSNSEKYNNAIVNFINNTSGIIKVFVEHELKKEKNFLVYQTLIDLGNNNKRVVIKKTNKDFIEEVESFFSDKYHFLVADKCMYRVETEIDTFKAIASFNSPDFSTKLSNLFNKYFD
jgi:hypothetical protein